MKIVTQSLEIMAAAGCQGVVLNDTEAAILLGYLEGEDYRLMMDDHRKLWLHDNQDGEKDENDTPYTIRDVIEFCQEANGEILLDAESSAKSNPDYILGLRKDEMLLGCMMERTKKIVPPVAREYKVIIVEHLRRVVPVNAENWADAELKVREAYDRAEIVLGADDFVGVSFSMGG